MGLQEEGDCEGLRVAFQVPYFGVGGRVGGNYASTLLEREGRLL